MQTGHNKLSLQIVELTCLETINPPARSTPHEEFGFFNDVVSLKDVGFPALGDLHP